MSGLMQISEDKEYASRSRLVLLAYEVIRDIKIREGATDAEICSLLSQAFMQELW
jgi:hypothetical protein